MSTDAMYDKTISLHFYILKKALELYGCYLPVSNKIVIKTNKYKYQIDISLVNPDHFLEKVILW